MGANMARSEHVDIRDTRVVQPTGSSDVDLEYFFLLS
jgi:hypothetical protein